MSYEKMSPLDRVTSCHIDFARNKEFALLSGLAMIGKTRIDPKFPTAATDGYNTWYGEDFVMKLSRTEMRFVVAHECLHKALKHCTSYPGVMKKHGMLSNMAMDYVVNLMIVDMNTRLKAADTSAKDFATVPNLPGICLDEKYRGMDFLEVLLDLLKQQKQGGGKGSGKGSGKGGGAGQPGGPLDEHVQPEEGDGEGALTEEQKQEIGRAIDDAIRQGDMLAKKLRGEGKGGMDIDNIIKERDTNWQDHFREFFTAVCEGDDYSTYRRPNKRMLASGFLMPTHFSEATGEIIVACDTSGSMGGTYPIIFGEIVRICQSVRPDAVRVIWWDTEVNSEQVFTPDKYEQMAHIMKPQGGGGTTVSCVAQYIAAKQYKPTAVVYLTDGYIESSYDLPPADVPLLWGILDNDGFQPLRGQCVRLYSDAM